MPIVPYKEGMQCFCIAFVPWKRKNRFIAFYAYKDDLRRRPSAVSDVVNHYLYRHCHRNHEYDKVYFLTTHGCGTEDMEDMSTCPDYNSFPPVHVRLL